MKRVLWALLLLTAPWQLAGCGQRSLCGTDPDTCDVKLTALEGSLTDQGGKLILRLDYKKALPDPTQIDAPSKILQGSTAGVTLIQGAVRTPKADVPLVREDDRSVSLVLAPADVQGFKPGKLSVEVTVAQRGTVSGTFSISKRLPFGAAVSATTPNAPVWAGPWKPGLVVTIEGYTDPNLMEPYRKISPYTFMATGGGALSGPGADLVMQRDPSMRGVVVGDSMVQYRAASGGNLVLQSCALSPYSCNAPKSLPGIQAQALAAGTSLTVVQADGALLAFGDVINFSKQVPVDAARPNLPAPALLGVGDLNQDGLLDVVATAAGVTQVLLQSVGTLRYDAGYSQALQGAIGSGTVAALALGNLDRTNGGLADVVVATDKTVRLVQNLGAGSFVSADVNTLTAPAPVSSIAVGDVDGDGKNDLVLTNTALKGLYVVLNQSQ